MNKQVIIPSSVISLGPTRNRADNIVETVLLAPHRRGSLLARPLLPAPLCLPNLAILLPTLRL